MKFRYPLPRMVLELVKARGDVNRMADRRARQDAARLSTAELVSAIRDNADHPWKPPVGGITAALGHDVIHGLDITVALGIERRVPQDRGGKWRCPGRGRRRGCAPAAAGSARPSPE